MGNEARDLERRVVHAEECTIGRENGFRAPAGLWGADASPAPPSSVVDAECEALERCRALGLSPARLRFYRWLVQTGRLHD
jgi:hypothetical protein